VRVETRAQLLEALVWARARALQVTILGGGSNVVVSDRGIAGLVVQIATRGIDTDLQPSSAGDLCLVEAQAGEPWDGLVEYCIERALAGIECLSGIPGQVGAGPIQNIGAYGQEIAESVHSVEVLDLVTLETRSRSRAECQFDYRTSRWKRHKGQEIVLSVRLALRAASAGTTEPRYPELARALSLHAPSSPTLTDVRSTVLALRRGKSMLIERDSSGRAIQDENRRSVGSFFLNPVVSATEAQVLIKRAQKRGLIQDDRELPRYPHAMGMVKLSAAWLIEHAGTRKGERHGQVGVSSRHCLALVHHGGGSTSELLELASTLQARVREIFGIEIVPEPVLLGFETGGSVSQPE